MFKIGDVVKLASYPKPRPILGWVVSSDENNTVVAVRKSDDDFPHQDTQEVRLYRNSQLVEG